MHKMQQQFVKIILQYSTNLHTIKKSVFAVLQTLQLIIFH